ncbi:MAG: deoxyribodipyrimidine photo-lyase, partial [Anaerolineae bacterium]|nr:deoxyribodipyrimidine photo-lyase [Anaerolineae bacterium]
MTNIWWIRRDLRLTDNAALHAALEAGATLP